MVRGILKTLNRDAPKWFIVGIRVYSFCILAGLLVLILPYAIGLDNFEFTSPYHESTILKYSTSWLCMIATIWISTIGVYIYLLWRKDESSSKIEIIDAFFGKFFTSSAVNVFSVSCLFAILSLPRGFSFKLSFILLPIAITMTSLLFKRLWIIFVLSIILSVTSDIFTKWLFHDIKPYMNSVPIYYILYDYVYWFLLTGSVVLIGPSLMGSFYISQRKTNKTHLKSNSP